MKPLHVLFCFVFFLVFENSKTRSSIYSSSVAVSSAARTILLAKWSQSHIAFVVKKWLVGHKSMSHETDQQITIL